MLEALDLEFVLTIPVFINNNDQKIAMPSANMLYFNLKDIPVSHVSKWEKLWLSVEAIAKWFMQ